MIAANPGCSRNGRCPQSRMTSTLVPCGNCSCEHSHGIRRRVTILLARDRQALHAVQRRQRPRRPSSQSLCDRDVAVAGLPVEVFSKPRRDVRSRRIRPRRDVARHRILAKPADPVRVDRGDSSRYPGPRRVGRLGTPPTAMKREVRRGDTRIASSPMMVPIEWPSRARSDTFSDAASATTISANPSNEIGRVEGFDRRRENRTRLCDGARRAAARARKRNACRRRGRAGRATAGPIPTPR